MIGIKLLNILGRMNGVEKRAFSRFLDSTYYNQRPELKSYWKLLQEDGKASGSKFSAQDRYAQLFPDRPFDLVHFRHINSWLLKKMEQFFILRKNEAETFNNQLALAVTYREKKLEPLFKKHLEIARKGIISQKLDPEHETRRRLYLKRDRLAVVFASS